MSKKRIFSEVLTEEEEELNLEPIIKKRQLIKYQISSLESDYDLTEGKILKLTDDKNEIKNEIKNRKQKLDQFINESVSESHINHLQQLYEQKLKDKQIKLFKSSDTDEIEGIVYKELISIFSDSTINIIKVGDNITVFEKNYNHYILFVCKDAIIKLKLEYKSKYDEDFYFKQLLDIEFKSGNYSKLLSTNTNFGFSSDILDHIDTYFECLGGEKKKQVLANVHVDHNNTNYGFVDYDMKYDKLYLLVKIVKAIKN